jgi:hypothetical protein
VAEINLLPSDFERGYRAYQEREPRDAMYKTARFLVENFWGQPRDMADGMGVLLLTWNQSFYRYGSFDFALLEEALRANMPIIEGLRPRNILSLAAADEPTIKRLFLEFLDALRIKGGKKKDCKSPVAVAKALHLLAPSFMPIWDDKIARAYACHYRPNPDRKYVVFAYEMKTLAQQLREHVPSDCGRTFLKLIDEYNYAKHTKGWI